MGITNATEYEAAMAVVEALMAMDPKAETEEAAFLKKLAADVEAYERVHYPIGEAPTAEPTHWEAHMHDIVCRECRRCWPRGGAESHRPECSHASAGIATSADTILRVTISKGGPVVVEFGPSVKWDNPAKTREAVEIGRELLELTTKLKELAERIEAGDKPTEPEQIP